MSQAINSRPASVSAASAQELTQQLAHLAMQNQKLRLQIVQMTHDTSCCILLYQTDLKYFGV